MCTNKRWIRNKYDGKKYFVTCGHCEACQMEKANKVAQKIRNNSSKNWITLFVHLTYANSCIPYIRKTDLYKGLIETPIYRDSINRRKRLGSGYATEKCRTFKTVQIGSYQLLDIPDNVESIENLPSPTHIDDPDKVGVIFLPDIQNYIKRLRAYVKYYADTYQKFDFSWFQLAEYGETFSRCHFHLLFRIPANASLKLWKSALSANWLYDDYNTTYRNIQVAIQASNYVSSYINRPTTIPPFFYQKQLAPKRSHSFRFGQAIPEFSLEEICKKIDLRNLTYDVYGIRKDGTFGTNTFPYPRYIINRFFPKFKGYFRLTTHEVEDVINNSQTILREAKIYGWENLVNTDIGEHCQYYNYNVLRVLHILKVRCEYELKDYYPIFLRLSNAKRYFDDYFNMLGYDYASYYVECYKVIFKHLMELQYYQCVDELQQYDNLFVVNFSSIPTFENKVYYIKNDFPKYIDNLEHDPNKFTLNVERTKNLTDLFYKRDKQHKFNNQLYIMKKYGRY